MTVDNRLRAQFTELSRQRQAQRQDVDHLPPGDGGGTSGGMEHRVTRLEVEMEAVRRDLSEILGIVRELPTKNDLATFRWQWVATAVAAIALIVGGIIGGLGWIKPDAPAAPPAPTAPIILQVPTATPPASDAGPTRR